MESSSLESQKEDRVGELLGPLQRILTPTGTIISCSAGWAATAFFSSAPLAIGLCWWGIALLLFSIQIERPWLNILPFPPLTVLALHLFLRWELGGLILLLAPPGKGDLGVWSEHVYQALPINAAFSTALIGIGALNWRLIRKSVSGDAHHQLFRNISGFDGRRLLLLALITGTVAIGYVFAGFFGGTLDRGALYLQWAGKLWRPDTLFVAALRLRDIYFIVLPWVLWRWRKTPAIVAFLSVATLVSLFLSVLLGGRGLIIYPALLILGGIWLVGVNPKLLRSLLLGVCVVSIAVTALWPSLRNTPAFQKTRPTDLAQRGALLQTTIRNTNASKALTEIGRDLYAWSDPYLFIEPGISQQPAGAKRLKNLIYLWTPKAIMPDRPEINDGHLIVKEIMGQPTAGMHEGRHIWFPGISFGGDLYWRFRWQGVILGSITFGLFYALFSSFWYRLANLNRSTFSVLVALYPSTFLQGPPLRSVSETIWNWFYEFPKYILILAAVGIIIELISALWRRLSRN